MSTDFIYSAHVPRADLEKEFRRTGVFRRRRRLLVKIGFVFQALDVGEHFIKGLHDHARDPAGVVELTEELEILEILRGFQLAREPRAEASIAGRQEVHVVADQPESPLGDGTAHGMCTGLGMA